MKKFSMIALAAVLLAGSAALPFAASAGGKKEAPLPDSPTNFVLSKQVRDSAAAATLALKAHDLAGAEVAVSTIERSASTDSERYIGRTLRVKLLSASPETTQSRTAMVKPLDELIADPRTPRDDLARYAYTRGDFAYARKEYAKAVQFYRLARDNGLRDDELSLQIVRANMEGGTVSAGAAELDSMIAAQIAAGKKPPESWYRFATQRLRLKRAPETAAWTGKWLAAYGTRANWHDVIAINGFKDEDESNLTLAERKERDTRFVDLFRLMRVTKSLGGQKEYLEYARRANSLGLKDEVKAVIEEGRATGAIPPKDPESVRLYASAPAAKGKAKAKTAPAGPTEAAARKAAGGELAAQVGDANIGRGAYAKAIEMYDLALEKTVADPDIVRLHRGIALALSGDKERARADLSAVTAVPAGETATLWKIWLDAAPAA
jgi:tetratricopeptide (TPR) repeat protein